MTTAPVEYVSPETRTRTTPRSCNLCGEQKDIRPQYRKGNFSVVRCRACSLVYVDELPTQAGLEKIYSPSFFEVGEKFAGASKSPSLVNAQQRIDELVALPEVQLGRWLDVGCATGDFLLAAAAVVSEADGVEMSAYAAERAKTRGVSSVHTGDFLDVELEDSAFDFVSMWDYIEHVTDPVANLRRAFQILRPGGYLALTTGDIESLAARFMGRYWHLMIPPKHLYFFSPKTIEEMLTNAGFRSISITWPGKRVPFDFVTWKLTNLFLPNAGALVLRINKALRLGKLAPFVNLYDIMTVYARKHR